MKIMHPRHSRRAPSLSPSPDPSSPSHTHIFLIQRSFFSHHSSAALTQQTLACYTSSTAAIQHAKAQIWKIRRDKVHLTISNGGVTSPSLSSQVCPDSDKVDIEKEWYREGVEWIDPKMGMMRIVLRVVGMEIRDCFAEEGMKVDEGLNEDEDLDIDGESVTHPGFKGTDHDSMADSDMEMSVDDDTLVDFAVDVDGHVNKSNPSRALLDKLPPNELQSSVVDDRGKANKKNGDDSPETYFRDFHTLIESLHVHDHEHPDRKTHPIVYPHKQVPNQPHKLRAGTQSVYGEGESCKGATSSTETTKPTDNSFTTPIDCRTSRKRARGSEEGDREVCGKGNGYEDGNSGASMGPVTKRARAQARAGVDGLVEDLDRYDWRSFPGEMTWCDYYS